MMHTIWLRHDAHKISEHWFFESNNNYESILRFRRRHVSFRKRAAHCTLQVEKCRLRPGRGARSMRELRARRGGCSTEQLSDAIRSARRRVETAAGRRSRSFFVFAAIFALDVVHLIFFTSTVCFRITCIFCVLCIGILVSTDRKN